MEASVLAEGVFCDISVSGSTDIPMSACVASILVDSAPIDWPNGFSGVVSVGFSLAILNIALGLSLEIYPSSCQETLPSGPGHPMCIEPPNPSLNGT